MKRGACMVVWSLLFSQAVALGAEDLTPTAGAAEAVAEAVAEIIEAEKRQVKELNKRLGMKAEQNQEIAKIYQEHDKVVDPVTKELVGQFKKLAAKLRDKDATDSELRALIDEIKTTRSKIEELEKLQDQRIKATLTPRQEAIFMLGSIQRRAIAATKTQSVRSSRQRERSSRK